jgi:hypothetical protein
MKRGVSTVVFAFGSLSTSAAFACGFPALEPGQRAIFVTLGLFALATPYVMVALTGLFLTQRRELAKLSRFAWSTVRAYIVSLGGILVGGALGLILTSWFHANQAIAMAVVLSTPLVLVAAHLVWLRTQTPRVDVQSDETYL